MKKEKFIKEIRIVVPLSLYSSFLEKCDKQYKTISEVLRGLILNYIRKNENE